MLVLRCTQRLLRRLRVDPEVDPPESTGRLGDWYANLVYVGREQFVVAVSERTLLPAVVAAAPVYDLVPRLRIAVREVMRGLGIESGDVEREESEMSEIVCARTASKRVLGVMNDFAFALSYYREDGTLRDIALKLARTPVSPLYKHTATASPDLATVALFGGKAPLMRGVH